MCNVKLQARIHSLEPLQTSIKVCQGILSSTWARRNNVFTTPVSFQAILPLPTLTPCTCTLWGWTSPCTRACCTAQASLPAQWVTDTTIRIHLKPLSCIRCRTITRATFSIIPQTHSWWVDFFFTFVSKDFYKFINSYLEVCFSRVNRWKVEIRIHFFEVLSARGGLINFN